MSTNTDAISTDDELNIEWSDDAGSQSRPTVLHLVDPGSPGGGACTLHLIADVIRNLPSVEHRVMVVGTAKHLELAQRCGVPVTAWISPVKTLPFSGQRALQRYLHHSKRQGCSIDVLHAWTPRTASLAAMSAPGLGKVAFTMPHLARLASLHVSPLRGIFSRYFRRVLERRPLTVLASSSSLARDCKRLGVPANHISLFPPAVDSSAADFPSRREVRERWRREHGIDEGTFLVGLLGEPISWPDARAAATSVARVALSGRRVRLVLHHRAMRRIDADRFLNHLKLADLLVLEDRIAEPWRIARGLDAALIPGVRPHRPAPSMLPTLWALAAGVPTILEWSDSADLVDDEVSGLLIDPHDVNAASLQIVRLMDDRALGQRIGEAAQARIAEIHDIGSYAVRLRHTYDLLLAGRPALAEA